MSFTSSPSEVAPATISELWTQFRQERDRREALEVRQDEVVETLRGLRVDVSDVAAMARRTAATAERLEVQLGRLLVALGASEDA